MVLSVLLNKYDSFDAENGNFFWQDLFVIFVFFPVMYEVFLRAYGNVST